MKAAAKVLTFPLAQQDPTIIAYERGLIGGCLADTRGVRAWPTLQATEFYLERHRVIWEAMTNLTETTEHPTLLDVTEALRAADRLDEVGGVAAVAEMVEAGTPVFDLQGYGSKVREAATARAKQKFAADLASDPDMPAAVIEQSLRALESGSAVASASPTEVLRVERERINTEPAIFTGLPNLDRRTHGIYRGQVLVLGGRTSHAKTTFAAFLGWRLAQREISVDYLSLEERDVDIIAKWTAVRTGIPTWQIQRGHLSPDEERRVDAAAAEIETMPLRVFTSRSHYESEVIAAVAASKAEVVVLDHIQQIITPSDEPRAYALERIMSRLAAIAVADRKLIVVCAQINRRIDGSKEAPTLADLRDSGGIEQIARTVWFTYYPSKHDPKRPPTDFEIIIAKAATGPTGVVDMFFDYSCGRFEAGEEGRDD
jgi:replicative DNA helicase